MFTPCVVLLCGTRAVAVLTGTHGCTLRVLTCLLRNVLAEKQDGRTHGEVEGGAARRKRTLGGGGGTERRTWYSRKGRDELRVVLSGHEEMHGWVLSISTAGGGVPGRTALPPAAA